MHNYTTVIQNTMLVIHSTHLSFTKKFYTCLLFTSACYLHVCHSWNIFVIYTSQHKCYLKCNFNIYNTNIFTFISINNDLFDLLQYMYVHRLLEPVILAMTASLMQTVLLENSAVTQGVVENGVEVSTNSLKAGEKVKSCLNSNSYNLPVLHYRPVMVLLKCDKKCQNQTLLTIWFLPKIYF